MSGGTEISIVFTLICVDLGLIHSWCREDQLFITSTLIVDPSTLTVDPLRINSVDHLYVDCWSLYVSTSTVDSPPKDPCRLRADPCSLLILSTSTVNLPLGSARIWVWSAWIVDPIYVDCQFAPRIHADPGLIHADPGLIHVYLEQIHAYLGWIHSKMCIVGISWCIMSNHLSSASVSCGQCLHFFCESWIYEQ